MTYFGFLLQFVVVPGLILAAWAVWDWRRGKRLPRAFQGWPAVGVLLLHSLIALVYTTPWDNYLVATRVWWYDESLVTGIVIGWVPIEEYTFFVLQPLLTGLLLITFMRYVPLPSRSPVNTWVRPVSLVSVGLVWIAAAVILLGGWRPGTYLGLELIWALPPIMLQLAFGADILWKHRRVTLPTLVIATLFLAWADSLAIGSGTWTIDPEQSLSWIHIGGILPIEEFIFFLLTNVLLVFGATLILAQESHERFRSLVQRVRNRRENVDLAV